MLKVQVQIIAILLLISCSSMDHEQNLEQLVAQEIDDVINQNDQLLWTKIESEVFGMLGRIADLEGADTLAAFQRLNFRILTEGYLPEFFVASTTQVEIDLITPLRAVGFNYPDECAHRFLHTLCEPLLEQYQATNDISIDPKNLIAFYGSNDPDSISMYLDLNILGLEKERSSVLKKSWAQPGSRKILILMYLSKMIVPRDQRPQ